MMTSVAGSGVGASNEKDEGSSWRPDVFDFGNGSYRVDVVAPQGGAHVIEVSLGGIPIKGSPWEVRVREAWISSHMRGKAPCSRPGVGFWAGGVGQMMSLSPTSSSGSSGKTGAAAVAGGGMEELSCLSLEGVPSWSTSRLLNAAPQLRLRHGYTGCMVGKHVVLVGGECSSSQEGSVLVLEPGHQEIRNGVSQPAGEWRALTEFDSVSLRAWPPRSGAGCCPVLDPGSVGNKGSAWGTVVLLGGRGTGSGPMLDVHLLRLDTHGSSTKAEWSKLDLARAATRPVQLGNRVDPGVAATPQAVYVFGGLTVPEVPEGGVPGEAVPAVGTRDLLAIRLTSAHLRIDASVPCEWVSHPPGARHPAPLSLITIYGHITLDSAPHDHLEVLATPPPARGGAR